MQTNVWSVNIRKAFKFILKRYTCHLLSNLNVLHTREALQLLQEVYYEDSVSVVLPTHATDFKIVLTLSTYSKRTRGGTLRLKLLAFTEVLLST